MYINLERLNIEYYENWLFNNRFWQKCIIRNKKKKKKRILNYYKILMLKCMEK